MPVLPGVGPYRVRGTGSPSSPEGDIAMLAMILATVTPYLCGMAFGGALTLHGVAPAEATAAGLEMARGVAIVQAAH